MQSEAFYDSMILYITLLLNDRIRGRQIPVCMKKQSTSYQDVKYFNPDEGSTVFFPQSQQQVTLIQFVLQA